MLKSRFSDKHSNPAMLLVVKYNSTALDSNKHCVAICRPLNHLREKKSRQNLVVLIHNSVIHPSVHPSIH